MEFKEIWWSHETFTPSIRQVIRVFPITPPQPKFAIVSLRYQNGNASTTDQPTPVTGTPLWQLITPAWEAGYMFSPWIGFDSSGSGNSPITIQITSEPAITMKSIAHDGIDATSAMQHSFKFILFR